jgi:hypothetical protein
VAAKALPQQVVHHRPAVWAGIITTNTELTYWLFVAPIAIIATVVTVGRSARRVGAWGNSN